MCTKLLITGLLFGGVGVLPLRHGAPADVARIDNALNEFYHKHPQEKVALVTDRDEYGTGETIWLSGFLTCLGKPSPISKVVYVELIDSSGYIDRRLILPVEEGVTEGNLFISDEFPAGRYQLRAYTRWMLNSDAALFFHKEIYLGDRPAAGASADYTFEWFPEGGNLVEGLTSKLAFRARRSDGCFVDITGKLIDSSGKAVKSFATLHDGMGSLVVHPAPGNSYSALIAFPGGNTKIIPLPVIKPSGVVLYVNHFLSAGGDDSVYFRLSRSVADKEKYQHLVLCAQMEGRVDFTFINFDDDFAGNYNNSVLTAPTALAIDSFGSGVLHLTVFDDKEEPLAERLVYLQRPRRMAAPVVSWDVRSFDAHGKNTFRIEVPGDSAGVYSVSVTRAGDGGVIGAKDGDEGASSNILSTFLLSADIHNEVRDWGWYCRNAQPETLHALDLLLLTSTWARFDWKKILHSDYPPVRYFAEPYLAVKGQAFWGSGKGKKPMRNGEFSLMVKAPFDSLFDLMQVPVDSEGRFSLVNLSFHDTASVYVQNHNQKKDKVVTVIFDRDPLDTIRTVPPLYKPADSGLAAAAANTTTLRALNSNVRTGLPELAGQHKQKDTTILSTALVRGHRKTKTDSLLENYATGMFANPGTWAKTMDFTDDKSTENRYDVNVIDYLQGKVAGLQWSSTMIDGQRIPLVAWRFTNGLFVSSNPVTLYERNAPAFFLNDQFLSGSDGNYVTAMELLTNIPIAQIAMIRIFQPGSIAAVEGMAPHGVIAIYTKNGTEGKFRYIASTFNKIKKLGYAPPRSFSAPDYDHVVRAGGGGDPRRDDPHRDDRKTLYWNPALTPDSATHTATFTFFNDDTPGTFRVTIQGLDRNGRLVHIDSVFTK